MWYVVELVRIPLPSDALCHKKSIFQCIQALGWSNQREIIYKPSLLGLSCWTHVLIFLFKIITLLLILSVVMRGTKVCQVLTFLGLLALNLLKVSQKLFFVMMLT